MDRLEMEMKMALGFGKAMIESGRSLPPLILVRKGNDNLFIGMPNAEDADEKAQHTGMLAMAARAWGGTEIIWVCDSYYVEYGKDDLPPSPDNILMPSEDPRAQEAILVNAFRTDGPDIGFLAPYHHTAEGIQFDEEKPLPESDTDAEGGMVPETMHRALRMTDEQMEKLLANAPVPGGISSAHELLVLMTGMGFMVMEG